MQCLVAVGIAQECSSEEEFKNIFKGNITQISMVSRDEGKLE